MDMEAIVGGIIMLFCCWICGDAFLIIGIYAKNTKKPMHFYSGSKIDPETVTDIAAYNRANSKLWILYSIPYFLAGIMAMFGFYGKWAVIVAVIIAVSAAFPGTFLLIQGYHRIERKYIRKR